MDKLVAGAVAYREKKGEPEWFVVKSKNGERWELPKSDVKRGESSVQAVIRYTQETAGLKASVLEEAGRVNVTATIQGAPIEEKVIFYLMRNGNGEVLIPSSLNSEWLKFASAKKRLSLIREQKMLTAAHDILREWQQKRTRKH